MYKWFGDRPLRTDSKSATLLFSQVSKPVFVILEEDQGSGLAQTYLAEMATAIHTSWSQEKHQSVQTEYCINLIGTGKNWMKLCWSHRRNMHFCDTNFTFYFFKVQHSLCEGLSWTQHPHSCRNVSWDNRQPSVAENCHSVESSMFISPTTGCKPMLAAVQANHKHWTTCQLVVLVADSERSSPHTPKGATFALSHSPLPPESPKLERLSPKIQIHVKWTVDLRMYCHNPGCGFAPGITCRLVRNALQPLRHVMQECKSVRRDASRLWCLDFHGMHAVDR